MLPTTFMLMLMLCIMQLSEAFNFRTGKGYNIRFTSPTSLDVTTDKPTQSEFIGMNKDEVILEIMPDANNDDFTGSRQIKATVGTALPEVFENNNININYKCKKGECGTCEVKIDGQWVRTCQAVVEPLPVGQLDPSKILIKKFKKRPAKFFSPKSFAEGVFNNGLGVLGFVKEGAKSNNEFVNRMDREDELAARVAARKRELEGKDLS